MSALTLFYDGQCALCTSEMARLRRWDGKGRLAFVDIAAPGFSAVPGVERGLLGVEMHSLRAGCVVLVGSATLVVAGATAAGGRPYRHHEPVPARILAASLRLLDEKPAHRRHHAADVAHHPEQELRWII